jgi:hypothetical protein
MKIFFELAEKKNVIADYERKSRQPGTGVQVYLKPCMPGT